MFQKYFFIANYLLIILVGSIYFYKIKDSKPLRLFFGFLIYSLLTEVVGTYFTYFSKTNNAVIYNSWNLVAYIFYSYFFLNYIKSPTKQLFIKVLAGIVVIAFLSNAIFVSDLFTDVFRYNSMLNKFFMCIVVMLYFDEILRSDLILHFKSTMSFWVALGVFIYNIGLIPIFVITELVGYIGLFEYITYLLNIMMGISFITGFVVSKKEYNN